VTDVSFFVFIYFSHQSTLVNECIVVSILRPYEEYIPSDPGPLDLRSIYPETQDPETLGVT
jgi:hypothetical protein